MDDLFLIAETKSAFGTDGYILIDSFSDFKDRFFELKYVFVQIFGNYKKLEIESVKQIDNEIIIKFHKFNNASEVEVLLHKKLFVDKNNVVQLEKDNFFIHDLVDCSVFRNNEFIGKVNDVLILPANDVLEILNNEKKILVPFVKTFLDNVDVEKKVIVLRKDCDLLYDDEN